MILSPDRTFAALRREVVLKKPEVFKMACLSDIKTCFEPIEGNEDDNDDDHTPFYAGFGNRITDAISYRSVHIPLHRIFTINPNGEVHMELLELAGYKSSYLHIGELVDQFSHLLDKSVRFHRIGITLNGMIICKTIVHHLLLDLQGHQGHQGVLWKILKRMRNLMMLIIGVNL